MVIVGLEPFSWKRVNKRGKMDLEVTDCTKEAYEMQLFGFTSRTVRDCGNFTLRERGAA